MRIGNRFCLFSIVWIRGHAGSNFLSPCDSTLRMAAGHLVRAAAILAVCMAAQVSSAQAAAPVDLKALKAKYEQGLAGIQADSDKALTNSVKGYVEALKTLEQKLQAAGDLDGMLAVRKETERFGKEKAIPEGALAADSTALRELQVRWRKMPETIEIGKSRKIVLLSRGHIAALEDAKKQLTIQGKVDAALAAKEEIEHVKTTPEVTAAEFVLINAGVDMTPKATKVEKPEPAKPVAAAVVGPSSMPASLRSSLVLYYSFDRNEGKTVADKSGKGHSGQVYGAKWTSKGKNGGAYEFDGKGNYIDTKENFSGMDEITVCGWSFFTEVPIDSSVVTQYGDRDGNVWALFSGANGKGAQVNFCPENAVDYNFCGNAYELHKWKHLCATYARGKDLTLYEDGIPVNSTKVPNLPLRKTRGTAKVGASQGAGCYWGMGLIDEVMIFDRALTAKEIRQIYDSQKSRS